MIVFTDCDGVLHPACSEADQLFCRTEQLWKILRACPNVQVVFSTSWRETHRPAELIDFATYGGGEDLAHRFVGQTPILKSGEHCFHREAECREWLRINGCEGRPWLALDDTDFWFEGAHLYLVNHLNGLTDADVSAIIGRIESAEKRPPQFKHRHLNHDGLTLAAIDSIIERGTWRDWLCLARAIHDENSIAEKVVRLTTARLNNPRDDDLDRDLYLRWKLLAAGRSKEN